MLPTRQSAHFSISKKRTFVLSNLKCTWARLPGTVPPPVSTTVVKGPQTRNERITRPERHQAGPGNLSQTPSSSSRSTSGTNGRGRAVTTGAAAAFTLSTTVSMLVLRASGIPAASFSMQCWPAFGTMSTWKYPTTVCEPSHGTNDRQCLGVRPCRPSSTC